MLGVSYVAMQRQAVCVTVVILTSSGFVCVGHKQGAICNITMGGIDESRSTPAPLCMYYGCGKLWGARLSAWAWRCTCSPHKDCPRKDGSQQCPSSNTEMIFLLQMHAQPVSIRNCTETGVEVFCEPAACGIGFRPTSSLLNEARSCRHPTTSQEQEE